MQTSPSARAESEHLAPPLAALIERLAGGDGAHSTAIAGLTLYRFSRLGQPFHGLIGIELRAFYACERG